MNAHTQPLISLYQTRFGKAPDDIIPLRADGSERKLYRLAESDGFSVVGVYGPDYEENNAFLSFSRSLRSIRLPVPEIYADDRQNGLYLEEDLGDVTLLTTLNALRGTGDRFPAEILPVYKRIITLLPRLQIEGGKVVDYSAAYPVPEFDRRAIMWDLNYFKYHFLKLAHIPFNEARLETDFEKLCGFLLQADRTHFMHRDFQSRNIMLRAGNEPWFIDYQGGRRGALQYDVAKLLYDSGAALPERARELLLGHYLNALAGYTSAADIDRFPDHYYGFVLLRIMQGMGAYGYRGYFERKPQFLASVPTAIANIEFILQKDSLPLDMPELQGAFERIALRQDLRTTA